MAVMNLKSIASVGALDVRGHFGGLRGRFQDDLDRLTPKRMPAQQTRQEPLQSNAADEKARYERMLEREMDRELLTKVEQEDTEMLDRVRAALYAE